MPRKKGRRPRGQGQGQGNGGPEVGDAVIPAADGVALDPAAAAGGEAQGGAGQDLVQDEQAALQQQNAGEDYEPIDEVVDQGDGQDNDDEGYEPAPPPDPENEALLATLKKFKHYEQLVSGLKQQMRLPPQQAVNQLHELFIDSALGPDDLRQFYRASEGIFETYPMYISVELPDGTTANIRVTPEEGESVEDTRHHIISIRRTTDHAIARFAIEDHSGYAVGMQAYIEQEAAQVVPAPENGEAQVDLEAPANVEADLKPWLVFGDQDLPAHFGQTLRINYRGDYTEHLPRVNLHDAYGSNLIDFVLSFMPTPGNLLAAGRFDQRATKDGHILLETFFVVFCEGRRFSLLEWWAIHERGRIRRHYCDVVRDYLGLSTAVILLYLHLEEKRLALRVGGFMVTAAAKSKAVAISNWKTKQAALSHTELLFFEEEKLAEAAPDQDQQGEAMPTQDPPAPDLHRLAGSIVKLIRHERVNCKKLLMRQLGYDGPWV